LKYAIAPVSAIPDGTRLLVTVRGRSIGIFNVKGTFYAILNRCPHQGAELCKGSLIGRLEADAPGEFRYDSSRLLLQCPWHGWEYDLATGQSFFDSQARRYPIVVEDGEALSGELRRDESRWRKEQDGNETAVLHEGTSAQTLKQGPYVAERYEVSVESDYVVIEMPGRT
jgi:nitrite reductase/ring-hydroxylating ferredoxin subunit